MIESGSHEAADVAAWQLPAGTALRIEVPEAALRPFFEHYSVLDSNLAIFKGEDSWLLPGPPKLWIALSAPDLSMRARRRQATKLGVAALIGPTSVTVPVEAHGGISIVVALTPRGWARLIPAPAATLRDQIVPLDTQRPAAWVAEMLNRVQTCVDGTEVKGLLDGFFFDHLPPMTDQEEVIGRIEQILATDDGRGDVSTWHQQVGLGSPRILTRACMRAFGFGPKVLQRRRRFLNGFAPLIMSAGRPDFRVVPPGYHDVPHFLRDARHFLGMTAKQFIEMQMPYLRSVLLAQAAVLGSTLPKPNAPALAQTAPAGCIPDLGGGEKSSCRAAKKD